MSSDREQKVLDIRSPGDLQSATWSPAPRRAPGPGEVEIAVEAAALNFKDVLIALKMVEPAPGSALGSECSGYVAALGEGVSHLRIGDPVLALGRGCLARYATVPAHTAARIPASLTLIEAATLPVVLTTATYALCELGRLRAGERVLVHAAAGGVGLAALQIARRLGAEVLATAGNESKRAFLRQLGVSCVMDSRSLDFAEQLMDYTQGKGVDVVLNSLSGPFLKRSLSLLGRGGRLIELGIRDVMADTPIGMAAFKAGASLCVVGDGEEFPGIRSLWSTWLDAVQRRELAPLPHHIHPASAAGIALQQLASARHIGKVVLNFSAQAEQDGDALVVPPSFTRVCTGAPAATQDNRNPFHSELDDYIGPSEGPEVFERALRCGWSQVVISTRDLATRLSRSALKEALHTAQHASPSGAKRPAHPRPQLATEYVAPSEPLAESLALLWQEALGLDRVGVHDSFFELGGDSLLAVQLLARARHQLGTDLPPHSLVEAPTIAKLTARIAAKRSPARLLPETLVCLREGSGGAPLFLFHPVGGQVYVYRDLASLLPEAQSVYGIRARALAEDEHGTTIESLAAAYLKDLLALQPQGPYLLGGSSFGGVLAYETAQQLRQSGRQVALLAMLDAPGPGCMPEMFDDDASILGYLLQQRRPQPEEVLALQALSREELLVYFLRQTGARTGAAQVESVAEVGALLRLWRANQEALRTYAPSPYPGHILFFAATESDGVNVTQPERAWLPLSTGRIDVHPVPGTHITLNYKPNVNTIAEILRSALQSARHDPATQTMRP